MDNFNGPAFVAFADICGFKELLNAASRAHRALDLMYNKAYELGERYSQVNGLAVSDNVVAWVTDHPEMLDLLLDYLKELHEAMLSSDFLMRTSIARGSFRYQQRIELTNLQKGLMLGDAYLASYLANDKASIGSITIVHSDTLQSPEQFAPHHAALIREMRLPRRRGWEFFWSVSEADEIDEFQRSRKRAENARFICLREVYRCGRAIPAQQLLFGDDV